MLPRVPDPFDGLHAFVASHVPLSAADWDAIRAAFELSTVRRKGMYLQPGETCDRIAFLAQGCLTASYTTAKADVTTHIFVDGSFVADYYSYLTATPSRQTIRAVEDCALLAADRRAVSHLYESVPVWERLGRMIAEEVYLCAHERTASFLHETPEQRYVKLADTQRELLKRVPQYVIASYLGITPETLSRIRGRSAHPASG
jgi:CRP-like cAMP-binding protein